MSEKCNKNCYNCGNAYWGEKDEDPYCEITGEEIAEINTANAECGCWTPTVVDELKQQITDLQAQLAAKERQLAAAAKDIDYQTSKCPVWAFNEYLPWCKDCEDDTDRYQVCWRRRWEEASKHTNATRNTL